MKNYYKKKSSSPMVIAIPLAIAFVVVVAAAMFGRINTENRSRASYSGLQQCTSACNRTGIAARFIKDKAACALDCPGVIAKTMTCNQFCSENVKSASGTHVNPTTGAERDWSSQELCRKQCKLWVRNENNETGTPAPTSTIPTPTPGQFNCSTKCNNVPSQYRQVCNSACAQFNSGERVCPGGCNFPNQQVQNTCAQIFCTED